MFIYILLKIYKCWKNCPRIKPNHKIVWVICVVGRNVHILIARVANRIVCLFFCQNSRWNIPKVYKSATGSVGSRNYVKAFCKVWKLLHILRMIASKNRFWALNKVEKEAKIQEKTSKKKKFFNFKLKKENSSAESKNK